MGAGGRWSERTSWRHVGRPSGSGVADGEATGSWYGSVKTPRQVLSHPRGVSFPGYWSTISNTPTVPLASYPTMSSGCLLGERFAGTNTIPSGARSPDPPTRLFAYVTNEGLVGDVTSYTMMPPTRSSPMNAKVLAPRRPTTTPSGSGPLLSLRLSRSFPSSSALKLTIGSAVVRCSNCAPESHT